MMKAQVVLTLLLSSKQKSPDSKSGVLFNFKVFHLLSPTRWGTLDTGLNLSMGSFSYLEGKDGTFIELCEEKTE